MKSEAIRERPFAVWVRWVLLAASITAILFAGADFVRGIRNGWDQAASASYDGPQQK
jgi:hypothetical protein